MSWIVIMIRIVFSGLAVLLAGWLFSLLLHAGRKWLAVRADREHKIQLANGGNCRSQYFITVSSPEPTLAFKLLLNKVELAEVVEQEAEPGPPAEKTQKSQPAQPEKAEAKTASPVGVLQQVGSKAGAVAGWISNLSMLLPGSLGHGLGKQASRMREAQTQSTKMVAGAGRYERRAGGLSKNRTVKGQTLAQTAQDARPMANIESPYCAVTNELLPGEALSLTLQIGTSQKRYPTGSFTYEIVSEQMALDFPETDIPPITRQGTVHFAPIGAWRYQLLPVANIAMGLLCLAGLLFSLLLIWN